MVKYTEEEMKELKQIRAKVKEKKLQKRAEGLLKRIFKTSYLTPVRSLQEANELVPRVEGVIREYLYGIRRLRKVGAIIGDDYWKILRPYMKDPESLERDGLTWYEAQHVAWVAPRMATLTEELFPAMHYVGNAAYSAASKKAKNAANRETYESEEKSIKGGLLASTAGTHMSHGPPGWLYFVHKKMDLVVEEAGNMAGIYAEGYAKWEMLKEIRGFEKNPFGYIQQLYEMGLLPRGFKNVNGEEKYVVEVPLINIDGKRVLGTYVHGDREILYTHPWLSGRWPYSTRQFHDKEYTQLKPVKPDAGEREIE